jgi:hypothetical protein
MRGEVVVELGRQVLADGGDVTVVEHRTRLAADKVLVLLDAGPDLLRSAGALIAPL